MRVSRRYRSADTRQDGELTVLHALLQICMHGGYNLVMGVTVQIRNLDAAVQEKLVSAAAQEGLSLSAFLRRELTTLAKSLEVRERARRLNSGNLRNK